MNISYHRALALGTFALALTSCAIQDPEYAADYSKIPNTNYPANAIVGLWADVSAERKLETSQSGPSHELSWNLKGDTKTYYEIAEGGSGEVQQHTRYTTSGKSVTLAASLTWSYLGSNTWQLNLPSSDAYEILENTDLQIGHTSPSPDISHDERHV
jgi:hypothetical protein